MRLNLISINNNDTANTTVNVVLLREREKTENHY